MASKSHPRKRPLDDDDYEEGEIREDDDDLEEGEIRESDDDCEPPKIRAGVQIVCDFPPECVIIEERRPLMNMENIGSRPAHGHGYDRNPLKLTSHENKDHNFKVFKPKGLVANKPSGSRPVGKVKYWDPNESKEGSKVATIDAKEQGRRQKIKEVMKVFDEVHKQLSSKPKGERIANWKVPKEAANIVKQKMKWMDPVKIPGPICGVEVGDKFRFRSQLQLVGLHCQPHSGIDYTKINGKNLAISIVDSDRYSNKQESSDVLLYSGQGGGGTSFLSGKPALCEDQKLERGNLALKNSMIEKTPVRVTRRLKWGGRGNEVFVYDGLYTVEKCKEEKGVEGKMVFMFELHRVAGQPLLSKVVGSNRY